MTRGPPGGEEATCFEIIIEIGNRNRGLPLTFDKLNGGLTNHSSGPHGRLRASDVDR